MNEWLPVTGSYDRRRYRRRRAARMWFRSRGNIPANFRAMGWDLMAFVEPVRNQPVALFRIADDGPPLQPGQLPSPVR